MSPRSLPIARRFFGRVKFTFRGVHRDPFGGRDALYQSGRRTVAASVEDQYEHI
jgi:hypothetical protein